MFALIYKVMLRARVLWREVWTGALFIALLFSLGVYYSAQIFLIRTEFTWIYANLFGSREALKPAI
ncbi:hypothetical protein [Rhodoferax sp.]|uniref:hypothetical protein n=1 Tax=Rhodoferax sp. TaxID=50421 RepID=UPI002605FF9F|nr:hypothetical protein [Rhodoferax sp.]MDD3936086.1 hypothetical protein [Rhodoferax sp.]